MCIKQCVYACRIKQQRYNYILAVILCPHLCIALLRRSCQEQMIFKRMGVPGPTPIPVFGNMLTIFRKVCELDDLHITVCNISRILTKLTKVSYLVNVLNMGGNS